MCFSSFNYQIVFTAITRRLKNKLCNVVSGPTMFKQHNLFELVNIACHVVDYVFSASSDNFLTILIGVLQVESSESFDRRGC